MNGHDITNATNKPAATASDATKIGANWLSGTAIGSPLTNVKLSPAVSYFIWISFIPPMFMLISTKPHQGHFYPVPPRAWPRLCHSLRACHWRLFGVANCSSASCNLPSINPFLEAEKNLTWQGRELEGDWGWGSYLMMSLSCHFLRFLTRIGTWRELRGNDKVVRSSLAWLQFGGRMSPDVTACQIRGPPPNPFMETLLPHFSNKPRSSTPGSGMPHYGSYLGERRANNPAPFLPLSAPFFPSILTPSLHFPFFSRSINVAPWH